MPDREKYIEVLSKTAKTVKELNEDAPIKISLECIEDILTLLKEQDEIIKESESMTELFNDAVARCRKYMEKCGTIPVEKELKKRFLVTEKGEWIPLEQEQKKIIVHKKHVITWKRDDVFNMRNLYEAVCETLLDEGELIIARTYDHEKVEFVFYVTESGEAHGYPERNVPDREAGDGIPGGDDPVLHGPAME